MKTRSLAFAVLGLAFFSCKDKGSSEPAAAADPAAREPAAREPTAAADPGAGAEEPGAEAAPAQGARQTFAAGIAGEELEASIEVPDGYLLAEDEEDDRGETHFWVRGGEIALVIGPGHGCDADARASAQKDALEMEEIPGGFAALKESDGAFYVEATVGSEEGCLRCVNGDKLLTRADADEAHRICKTVRLEPAR